MRFPFWLNVFRSLRAIGLAAAAIPLAASSTALGYNTTNQTGSVGTYFWTDTMAMPAVLCTYEGAAGSMYFNGVRVKAPTAYWPDQNSDNDHEHGKIGMRTRIEHYNGSTWDVVKAGPEVKMWASESTAAALTKQTVSWSGPNSRRYRASVVLTWWKTNGNKLGRVWVLMDFHRRQYDNSVGSSCIGRHSNIQP